MLTKLDSRSKAESMISLTLFSAAATCVYRKRRVFPTWLARRSVGVSDRVFLEISVEDAVDGGGVVRS